MGNGGFGVAQIGGNGEHLRGINDAPSGGFAAFDFKRDNAAAGFLLAHRQFVLWMRGQSGVKHACHIRLLFQPARQLQGIFAVRLHSNFQGFYPF
jgi:hypothetical protein